MQKEIRYKSELNCTIVANNWTETLFYQNFYQDFLLQIALKLTQLAGAFWRILCFLIKLSLQVKIVNYKVCDWLVERISLARLIAVKNFQNLVEMLHYFHSYVARYIPLFNWCSWFICSHSIANIWNIFHLFNIFAVMCFLGLHELYTRFNLLIT